MDREKILEIVNKIEDLSLKYNDYEFITAIYILIRYGIHTCTNYMDSADLDKILAVIKTHRTIFDEQLNYQVDKILNSKQN